MATRSAQPLTVPSAGVIKGGQLDGWRFHFLHFRASTAGLQVVARCTPPNWPFPWDIPLLPKHFMQLRPIKCDRAKRIAVDPLIRHAYQLAGLPCPEPALKPNTTLRARVKRVSAWPF